MRIINHCCAVALVVVESMIPVRWFLDEKKRNSYESLRSRINDLRAAGLTRLHIGKKFYERQEHHI